MLCRVMIMMFNATFNNISAISWWFIFIGRGNRRKTSYIVVVSLLMEETGENH